MKPRILVLSAAALALTIGPALARGAPPNGGPPPQAALGPPPQALSHIPSGASVGPPSFVTPGPNAAGAAGGNPPGVSAGNGVSTGPNGISTGPNNDSLNDAANVLGKLNAAHANSQALAHANPKSIVGELSVYQKAMQTALALPTATPAEVTAQQNAITAARQQLASSANVTLSSNSVTQVDKLLGLTEVCSTCGT